MALADSLCLAIPEERLIPRMAAQEPPGRARTPDFMPVPFRVNPRVTVDARLGDLSAAPPGIKRVVSPFDARVRAHSSPIAFAIRKSITTAVSLPLGWQCVKA